MFKKSNKLFFKINKKYLHHHDVINNKFLFFLKNHIFLISESIFLYNKLYNFSIDLTKLNNIINKYQSNLQIRVP